MTKFRITRTSQSFGTEEKPCKDAIKEGQDLYGDSLWTVDIDSIFDFVKKIGETVIVFPQRDEDLPRIEIYDSYRE